MGSSPVRSVGDRWAKSAPIAAQRKADLYLLTGDEIPFVQDGLRDGEHIRHDMHQAFAASLASMPTPHALLTGTHDERLSAAVGLVDALLRPH